MLALITVIYRITKTYILNVRDYFVLFDPGSAACTANISSKT